MTEIRFYHLQQTTLDRALPMLTEKAMGLGKAILITAESDAKRESLDDLLWTYKPDGFLPHGMAEEKFADRQPVLIADKAHNPDNKASVLLATDGLPDDCGHYDLVCNLFDGNNETALQTARSQWKHFKEQASATLTYWQQNDQGRWEQKA